MAKHLIKQQTGPAWADANGNKIPVSRITQLEKLSEKHAVTIADSGMKLQASMLKFKEHLRKLTVEVRDMFLAENNANGAARDSFTFYNFNKEIKVEVKVNETIRFDEDKLKVCKDKFMSFLERSITSSNEFVKGIVMAAFETKRGKFDAPKLLDLLKYRKTVNDAEFSEALDALEHATNRAKTKMYFAVYIKSGDGEYVPLSLNFSALDA